MCSRTETEEVIDCSPLVVVRPEEVNGLALAVCEERSKIGAEIFQFG